MTSHLAGLYTIPCGQHFLATLARGLVDTYGETPERLAQAKILLPSRRAVHALRLAFLQETKAGKALLLPHMATFGELDEDAQAFGLNGGEHLPPMVDRLERQWWLGAALRRFDDSLGLPQSLAQADALGQLLDQLQTFDISPDDLQNLVRETDLAEHWQQTLKFLDTILRVWPNYLKETGRIDKAAHGVALLRAQAQTWRATTPDAPIIIAGVARYEPALLELLQSALALPQGAVVLPGFDRDMPPEIWQQLDPVHPDFLLRDLIERLGMTRDQIALWPGAEGSPLPARHHWLREALRPASATEGWQALQGNSIKSEALDSAVLVNAPNEQVEARAIALIVRQALETPQQTISLVTPDRQLARLVSAQLRRWGVEVDDSAGVPLLRTPLGAFLLLVVAAATPGASLHDMLALAKHPFTRLGQAPGEFHAALRLLEHRALHNGYVVPGFDGWRTALAAARISDESRAVLSATLDRFAKALKPLCQLLSQAAPQTLDDLFAAHLDAAEALAATNYEPGSALWEREEGECAARFFFDARLSIGNEKADGARYAELLRAWFAPLAVRSPIGQHPRVTIHGLIEARLQQADVTILAGLNEGVWPPPAPISPFLSRGQYRALGLPDPESRLGQAAHDFANAFSGGCVYLTRAARVGGTPTVEARWLLRLRAVLTHQAVADAWQQSGELWPQLAAALDKPAAIIPQAAPAPKPPRSARPRQLSVTQIERWLRDPYGLYASKILRLSSLAPLANAPGARERGELVHEVLEGFAAATLGRRLRPDDRALLQDLSQSALARYDSQPALQQLYRAYLAIVGNWFFVTDSETRQKALPWLVEGEGKTSFAFQSGDFNLTARADRLDRAANDALRIVDYKTGTAPSAADMKNGRAVQLTLTAAIAAHGGFGKKATVEAIEYWQTGSRDNAGKILALAGEDLATAMVEAKFALGDLVDRFDDEAIAYLPVPLPDLIPRHNDYAHLERILEWAFAEDAAEGGAVNE